MDDLRFTPKVRPQPQGWEGILAMKKKYPMHEPQPNRLHTIHTKDDAFTAMYKDEFMVQENGIKTPLSECTAIIYEVERDSTWLQLTWMSSIHRKSRELSKMMDFKRNPETLRFTNRMTHLLYEHWQAITGNRETGYLDKRQELKIKGDG